MFKLNEFLEKRSPTVKILAFGEGKTGKTTWTLDLMRLSKCGYHIIYLDCDKSMNVARNKHELAEYSNLITYIPLRDESNITIMPFVMYLLSRADFFYNPATGEVVADNRFYKEPSKLIPIKGSRIDNKTIIILDSLTAFCESMFNRLREKQGYQALSFDMDKLYGSKVQQYYGVLATEFAEFLDRVSNLNATLFVIAHTKTKEKLDRNGNVTERKIYPLATTVNSSELLSKYFDECLYFTARAGNYYISSQPSADICGVGGRQLEPKQYKQGEFSVIDLLKLYNYPVTESAQIHDINLFDEKVADSNTSQVILTSNKITL